MQAYLQRDSWRDIRPEDYGNGLLGAVNALNASGGRLVLKSGVTYTSTQTASITASNFDIYAHGATLNFIDDGTAAGTRLYLEACSNFLIDGLSITQTAAGRTSVYGLLHLSNCSNGRVVDLTTTGGSSCGIFSGPNCSNIKLIRPVVNTPKADGIHLARNQTDSLIDNPVVIGAQDDGISIYSIKQDGGGPIYPACARNTIINPVIRNLTVLGSGIALIGTVDCQVIGGEIDTVIASIMRIVRADQGGVYDPSGNTITGLSGKNAPATSGAIVIANAANTALNGISLTNNFGGVVILSSADTRCNGLKVSSTGALQIGVYDDAACTRTIVTGSILYGNASGATQLNGTGSIQANNIAA